MRRMAATLLVLLIPACAAPPSGFVTGTRVHTINVGGLDRTYRLFMPARLPTSAPLVVVLHGYSGSAKQTQRAYGWDGLADSGTFVVAYPDGLSRAWNVDGEGCCGRPDAVGFLRRASKLAVLQLLCGC